MGWNAPEHKGRGDKEEKVTRASDIKYNSTWYILTAINKPNKTNVWRSGHVI